MPPQLASVGRLMNPRKAGAGGDSTQKFSANFLTNPSLSQGLLQLTCQRADGALRIRSFHDQEGLVRYCIANEMVNGGYRRVENLYPTATDAPTSQTVTTVAGRSYVVSFTGGTSVAWTNVTSGPTSLAAQGGSRVGSLPFVASAATSAFTISGAVTFIQVEDVTNQIATQVPSEYVSRGTLSTPYNGQGVDAVKTFTTTNGNSLNSGVVTAGTGTSIPTTNLRPINAYPEITNIVLQTEDFATTWTDIDTPTLTANTNSCGLVKLSTINDTSAAALQGKRQAITGFVNTTDTKGVTFYFAKGTSTSSVIRLNDTTSGDMFFTTITWPGSVSTVANVLANGQAFGLVIGPTTASITVAPGTTLLVVSLSYRSATQRTVLSVLWNGIEAFTQVSGVNGYTGAAGDDGGADIWYLVNPTATSATIVVAYDVAPTQSWVAWSGWTGNDLTTPFSNPKTATNTAGAASSITIPLSAGDACVDSVFGANTSAVPVAGDNLIYITPGVSARRGGAEWNNTDGALNWTGLRSGIHYQCGARINAATSGAGLGTVPRIDTTVGVADKFDTLGNGVFMFWGRTSALNNIAHTHNLEIYPATDASLAVGATGTLLIGGVNVQVNTHNYPAPVPYLPTTTVAQLRTFDSYAQIGIAGSWYNATEGTMVATFVQDISSSNASYAEYVYQIGVDGNNRILLLRRRVQFDNTVNCLMRTGGVEQTSGDLGALGNATPGKVAYGWKVNDLAFALNGGTPVTVGTATIPTLGASNDVLGVGGSPSVGGVTDANCYGSCLTLTYYNVKKTNAQIQTLSVYP